MKVDKKQQRHDNLCERLAYDLEHRYSYETHREVPFHELNDTLRYIADVVVVIPEEDKIRIYEVKCSENGYLRAKKQLDAAIRCCKLHYEIVPHTIIVTEVDDEWKIQRYT